MSDVKVILVTGLPGAGKTTFARRLAARYHLPLIAKDLIKEPLLDVLGAADAEQSRRLSDASFAVLFSMARELVAAGTGFLLEGNFRVREHEGTLRDALGSAQLAQILCRVPEDVRVARLAAREHDPSRHEGHRFGERQSAGIAASAKAAALDEVPRRPTGGESFLELPSVRFIRDSAGDHTVFASLDDWMNLRATSP